MDDNIFEDVQSALGILETAVMVYETGRSDILECLSRMPLCCEYESEFVFEGMNLLCDFMREYYNEVIDVGTFYFSSNTMMEYYRLCREYGKLKRIPLTENPYLLRAKNHIHSQMNVDGCYYCSYHLQTKINHKWASGIVFNYDNSYFYEFSSLFSRLLYVFHFYDCTVKELRKEVDNLRRQQPHIFPETSQIERTAA